jgi:hypothetical protein
VLILSIFEQVAQFFRHAVRFHGHPRFTGDIDFFVRPTNENAARVLQVVHAFGFGELHLTTTDFTTPERIVQFGRPPNRIDILTSISGVEFDDAWNGRVPAKLEEEAVNFLSFDALIQNKKASNRDKDRISRSTIAVIVPRSASGYASARSARSPIRPPGAWP